MQISSTIFASTYILRSSFIRADVLRVQFSTNIVCACVRWNKSYTEYAQFSLRHYRLSPNFTLCVSIFVRSIDSRRIRCCRSFPAFRTSHFYSICHCVSKWASATPSTDSMRASVSPMNHFQSLSLSVSFFMAYKHIASMCGVQRNCVYVWALSPVLFLVVICLSFADESSNDILTCAAQP